MTQKSGAKFYKADLHIHTPASQDISENAFTPEDLVAAAVAKEIDILAITDHNSAGWIDLVRTAAAGNPVTIIPGVEITTPQGHVLALFEKDYETSKISDFLIQIGISRDLFGKEEAISSAHFETVIQRVAENGGIAIAAHANNNKGLLKLGKGQYNLKLVPSPLLGALELKEADIKKFITGSVPGYPKKACIQSSDAHVIEQIGERVTFFKMDEPCLYGIKQALLDHEVRVRFPWSLSRSLHPRIQKIEVNQGFFANQIFVFHEGLNCLIGGKGTGKSTVIEMLRYAFDDISSFEDIQEDNSGKITNLVGSGGSITVHYLDSDGMLKIIKRDVEDWETKSEIRDEQGSLVGLITKPTFFSQGELVQIAKDKLAQMDLIDQYLDLTQENTDEAVAIRALEANANDIMQDQDRLAELQAEIEDPKTGQVVTLSAYQSLESQLKDPIFKEMPQWRAEQAHLAGLEANINRVEHEFSEALKTIDLDVFDERIDPKVPNYKELQRLEVFRGNLEQAITGARELINQTLQGSRALLNESRAKIQPGFLAKETDYSKALTALDSPDVAKATQRFESLGRRLETLRGYTEEQKRIRKNIDRLQKARKEELEKLSDARKRRLRKREDKASSYQNALTDTIRIQLIGNGDRKVYEQEVQRLATGSRVKDTTIKEVIDAFEPHELVTAVLKDDAAVISDRSKISSENAKKLIDNLRAHPLEELLSLESVEMLDVPDITFVIPGNRTRPLKELSTGQKGTVILSIAMVEEAGPLVIDQPEEPLDTESIYGKVVTTLRNKKEERQFIFTTHNANVAVGADADLSHVLSATADKGEIQSTGAIDHFETNQLLLIHLEGGKPALDRRVQKYRTES